MPINKFVIFIYLLLINKVCSGQSNNIAFFPFNGNANDLSPNSIVGTVIGAILTEDRCGNLNSAYYFDGINDVITIPDNNVLDIGKKDYSLVAWIKTSSNNWGRIISKGSSSCQTGYMMRTGSSSASKIHLENAFQSSCKVSLGGTTTINDNQWHCIAGVVKRDSFARLYIDGAFNSQQIIVTSNFDFTNNNEFLIGANYQNSIYPEWFKGAIDDVKIFDKALTIQEVNNACYNLFEIIDTINICDGENYQGLGTQGIYYDTLNCNTVRKIILTVLPKKVGTVTRALCNGDSFEGYTSAGTYVDTLKGMASNGCDSIRTINITVLPPKTGTINQTICDGKDFVGYTSVGIYVDTLKGMASNGCDSIRTINLTVLPQKKGTTNQTICDGKDFAGYSSTGTYIDTLKNMASNGCDSIRTINLTVNQNYQTKQSKTICAGTGYDFNGQIISTEGEYIDTIPTLLGCDSLIILDLKIARNDFLGNDISICIASDYLLKSPSENTYWFDNTISKTKKINKTGAYWAKILDATGCEIIDTIIIQFNIKVFVPNVFSPNNDGINDCFVPNFSELSFTSYRLEIFDRWGSLIFDTESPETCWDGENRGNKCDAGVYTYFIEVQTESCKKTVIKGDVTLIK